MKNGARSTTQTPTSSSAQLCIFSTKAHKVLILSMATKHKNCFLTSVHFNSHKCPTESLRIYLKSSCTKVYFLICWKLAWMSLCFGWVLCCKCLTCLHFMGMQGLTRLPTLTKLELSRMGRLATINCSACRVLVIILLDTSGTTFQFTSCSRRQNTLKDFSKLSTCWFILAFCTLSARYARNTSSKHRQSLNLWVSCFWQTLRQHLTTSFSLMTAS